MINMDKVVEALQQNLKFAELLRMNDPFYVQKYIQDMLVKSLSYPVEGSTPAIDSSNTAHNSSEPWIIELNDYIIVRLTIPDRLDPKDVKAYISGNLITIKLPEGTKEKTAMLPKPVKAGDIAAAVKNNILEIKIPIDPQTNTEEIEIKYK